MNRERDALNRPFFLPRLPAKAYQGRAVVHWTLTIKGRGTGWLTPLFHATFREILVHTLARHQLACPVYVLMPDHMHLIWMGTEAASDQLKAMAFLRTHLEPNLSPCVFQHQPHDHVMRKDEAQGEEFENAILYLLNNPVRAGLVEKVGDWAFTGCMVPGYPNLIPFQNDYWQKFWRIYFKRAWNHGEAE